jgi:UMF1 family MFS transporter
MLLEIGSINSIAGLAVLVLAPVLGAIADRGGAKKRMLLAFALLGATMTAALALVAQGERFAAAALYVLATVGFSGSLTFCDSMLGEVAPKGRLDFVSGLGYAAGYLGGGILLAVNIAMVSRPEWFGLADQAAAVKASFLSVAVWWCVFSVPLLLFVPEARPARPVSALVAVKEGLAKLARTFRRIRALKQTFLFLIAYWLYIDGVDTIIRMATGYGRSLGLPAGSLLGALLMVQLIGFPAALAYGLLGQKIGAKRGLFLGLAVYTVAASWGWFLTEVWEFWVLAGLIGLVQGGVQALSRSLYQRLVPAGEPGEFFGFYNMMGKFSVMLGPVLMGIGARTGNERNAIIAVLLLIVLGGVVLAFVDEKEGARAAAAA